MIVMTEQGLGADFDVTVTEDRGRGAHYVNIDALDQIDGTSFTLILSAQEAVDLVRGLNVALDEIQELERQ